MSFAGQVVERCPSCGVEHDVSDGGQCEACHAPLRYWCRRHGRETGWLAAAACPRCAAEAVRAAPAPPQPAAPAPAPAAPARPPRPAPRFVPTPPGRSLREIRGEAPAGVGWKAPGTGGSPADILWLLMLYVIVGAVMGVVVGSGWNAGQGEAGVPLLGGLVGAGVGLLIAAFAYVVIRVSKLDE